MEGGPLPRPCTNLQGHRRIAKRHRRVIKAYFRGLLLTAQRQRTVMEGALQRPCPNRTKFRKGRGGAIAETASYFTRSQQGHRGTHI